MISPQDWAARRLRLAVEAAVELASETHAGRQALAVHGRDLLAEHVPAAIDRYPLSTDDDWRREADLVYTKMRDHWAAYDVQHDPARADASGARFR